MDHTYCHSPALSATSNFSDFTDEELDKYFASYVPLSNLPTPPPAKEILVVDVHQTRCVTTTATQVSYHAVSADAAADVQPQAPELEVYATHLSKLVPTKSSPQRPSISFIRDMLDRANLPSEIIAFAACILDALSQRFASSWRTCFAPESSRPGFAPSSHFNLHPDPVVSPDIIVLAALALAHDFMDDRARTTRHWALIEALSLFTVSEIDATKFCLLRDINFGLHRITEDMVVGMLRDMQRAGNMAAPLSQLLARRDSMAGTEERRPKMSLELPRTTVWLNGLQTPEPSP